MQPAEGIRFIHAAICQDVQAVEALAIAAAGEDELAALDERVAWLAHVVAVHTRGEEMGLYAELEQRAPHVGAGYLLDHVDEAALFAEMRRLIAAARAGEDGALARMRRQAISLTEHVVLHIRKENELVVPLVVALFTPAEQGAHAGKMIAAIPPEDMRRVLPWLVGNLSGEERVAYVKMLQLVSPPERFGAVTGWIRDGIGDGAWSEIAARL